MTTSTYSARYPALVRLSTDELEGLLAQGFDTDDDPDMYFIQAVLEVIAQRDNPNAEQDAAETEAAWQRFQSDYKDNPPKYLEPEIPLSPTTTTAAAPAVVPIPTAGPSLAAVPSPAATPALAAAPSPAVRKATPRRPLRKIGQLIVVAAIVAILGGSVAQAFGFNFWQAIAQWTQETFHFGNRAEVTTPLDSDQLDILAPLRNALYDDGVTTPVVPKWCMDTFSLSDFYTTALIDRTKYFAELSANDKLISITIINYTYLPTPYSGTYEKDDTNISEYTVNNIVHYIMSNNLTSGVTWTNSYLECTIQGDVSVDDLKLMINSIYEEE